MKYNSYYTYQKYCNIGGQGMIPVYPNVYSNDADGTQSKRLHISGDTCCSNIPPIYQWVNMNINTDYWCEPCDDTYALTMYNSSGGTTYLRCNEIINGSLSGYSFYNDIVMAKVGNCVSSFTSTLVSDHSGSTLNQISIPSSIKSIPDGAFSGCTNLVSCAVSESLTTIGNGAFSGCVALQNIDLWDNITSIGSYAFKDCDSLLTIHIPSGLTSIANQCFEDCSALLSITIPNSVTSIGGSAFEGCKSLTSINIPNSVTSIGYDAFWGCSGLTSINIPDGVTNIDAYTFRYCTSLSSCTIGNGVTSIGIYSFEGCSGLTKLIIQATTPPALNINAFDNTNNFTIYVPSESVNAYKSASGWSTYSSRIQAIPT